MVLRFVVPLALAAMTACSLPIERAVAHGPCRCVFPKIAKPGQKLRLNRTTAYKVIFNPTPAQFATSITPNDLASAYRRDAPSPTVFSLSRKQARRGVTFRVPDVPTGMYFVLIYDGGEGGAHTTWDYLHVPGRPPPPLQAARSEVPGRRAAPSSERITWVLAAVVGALALVIGVGDGWYWRRRAE